MIKLASRSGADAVKIQTINVDESYHKSSPSHKDLLETIKFIRKNSNSEICVLKCTSLYPPKDNMLNLNAINFLTKKI